MSLFAQLTANGIIAGSIYALVACGFALIFATNRFIHLAHGVTVLAGGYFLFTFYKSWQLPFLVAAPLAIVGCAIVGAIIYLLIYVPLIKKKASKVILLIASLGILILTENLIQLVYGASVKNIGNIIPGGLAILGARVTYLQMVIFATAILLLVLLYMLMHLTKLGRNMRAVADNPELASIVGINARKIALYSFMIGSALAGVAGILIGMEQSLQPAMGTNFIIKGFTAAVIGGITSVPGAIVGAFILGFAENYGAHAIGSGYKDAIAFVLLFFFLLFRPSGIFGIDKGVKDA